MLCNSNRTKEKEPEQTNSKKPIPPWTIASTCKIKAQAPLGPQQPSPWVQLSFHVTLQALAYSPNRPGGI